MEKNPKSKNLEKANRELRKYKDAEDVVLQLAGLPTKAQDRRNRIQAINRYFDILNVLGDGKVGGLPFSALYNQIRPVSLLFDFVAENTFYDKNSKCICIDGVRLYRQVLARIEEQNRLKADAKRVFEEMEKPPFGFLPNAITSFVIGFCLKEYANAKFIIVNMNDIKVKNKYTPFIF